MKTPLYIALSFCLVFLASCKKKALPTDDDDTGLPVFYAKCEVNGLPVTLTAGANDYYMNSSFYQDSATNVYVYKAELKQKNCTTNCNYALTILINDSKISAAGASMNVNEAIKQGDYIFNSNSLPPLGYRCVFTPVNTNTSDTYNWLSGDNLTQSGYSIARNLSAGIYSLTLDYQNMTCSASHLNVFDIGNPLQANITATRNSLVQGLSYNFAATPTGAGPYQYTWDFGDATPVSNFANPVHSYSKGGRYRVKLLITDSQNNSCTSYYQMSASPDNSDCSANYTALFTPIPNLAALSAVTVLITDATGKVSSSKDFVQPSGSNFQIVSVEDYKTNDQGQPTKKITIRFNCTLNNNNGPLAIKNGEAVIAVAYK